MSGDQRIWETRLLPEEVRQERRSLAGGRDEAGNLRLIPEQNLFVTGWDIAKDQETTEAELNEVGRT